MRWLLPFLLAACGSAPQTDPVVEPSRPSPPIRVIPQVEDPSDWQAMFEGWMYPDPIPPFQLTDHNGKTFALSDFADRWLMVGFIFTRCGMPEACPRVMKRMASVQSRWGTEGDAAKLQLLTVTVDPDYDEPARLKAYAERFNADLDTWTMATGPKGLVTQALPSLFNVTAEPESKGVIAHTVRISLLSPGLNPVRDYGADNWDADDVLARLHGRK